MSRGDGAELARRWLAALLQVPPEHRASTVDAVTTRILELYPDAPGVQRGVHPRTADPLLHVAADPVQHDGYTEVVVRSFAAAPTNTKPTQENTRERTGA